MYVFVYATHKKTELVWKIQPRFVFFFVWNIQFLDLNFEFLINNSRKKWKTIMLFRANYAGFFFVFYDSLAALTFNRLIPTSMYLLFQHTLKNERNKY